MNIAASGSRHQPLLVASQIECFRGERLLFRGLSLEVGKGEVLQVHGPNGSGKTTLLRILCGLTLANSGVIRWRDEDIAADPENYRRELIHIGHRDGIKMELSPIENLRVAQSLAVQPGPIGPEAALERFNLYGFEEVPVYALSAGQRRRVALARLLLNRACCWILDEPFTALDKAGIATMETLMREHALAGGVLVLTTHLPLTVEGGFTREIHLSG
jgi:heme exporter protein A